MASKLSAASLGFDGAGRGRSGAGRMAGRRDRTKDVAATVWHSVRGSGVDSTAARAVVDQFADHAGRPSPSLLERMAADPAIATSLASQHDALGGAVGTVRGGGSPTPLVSVIVPTRNRAPVLRLCSIVAGAADAVGPLFRGYSSYNGFSDDMKRWKWHAHSVTGWS